MKRTRAAALALLLVVAALAIVGALYVATFRPRARPASGEIISPSPQRLARGRYLVRAVLGCMDCHAHRDLARFGAPVAGPEGAGGRCLDRDFGMPGRVCAPNITPDVATGLGGWTDGEILRALREGVDRAGAPLFPAMPYTEFRALSDEDARSVVVYLRALPAVANEIEPTRIDFPVSFFVAHVPAPLSGPVPAPAPDRLSRGAYLARVSSCQFCHTPVDRFQRPVPGRTFAGGRLFPTPWNRQWSSNLTPHETGLGARDERAFVGMFKAFEVDPQTLPSISPAGITFMPWLSRAAMTGEDLGAIHVYLRTLPPAPAATSERITPVHP